MYKIKDIYLNTLFLDISDQENEPAKIKKINESLSKVILIMK